MSEEMQSNRRRQAQQDLGLDNAKEQEQLERAMQLEQQRQMKKQQRRTEIEQSSSYKATKAIAKWMDKFFLDPIIGFFAPGIGDMLTSVFVFPFIYVAACKVRSLPLTLAVIFNVLRDVALGLIPFWIGDIVDVFNRSFAQNRRLIVGFVEDDKEVIQEVNRDCRLCRRRQGSNSGSKPESHLDRNHDYPVLCGHLLSCKVCSLYRHDDCRFFQQSVCKLLIRPTCFLSRNFGSEQF